MVDNSCVIEGTVKFRDGKKVAKYFSQTFLLRKTLVITVLTFCKFILNKVRRSLHQLKGFLLGNLVWKWVFNFSLELSQDQDAH